MNARIDLHPDKHTTVLKGHPWLFPKAIAKQKNCQTGELVEIYDAQGQWLAVGMYNEHSLYRVRLISRDNATLDEIIRRRLAQAYQLRCALNLPNKQTNAYRLFNSEADGLSGLTIDRFETICVVASSAYWVEKNRHRLTEALQQLLPQDEIIWLSQPKPLAQDGWQGDMLVSAPQQKQILENGLCYEVDFSQTQKTGLFLDQRDNHQRIAAIAKDKRVLDLYTYTGGFALHAAKAGAVSVTAIDSSQHAIELAQRNAALNQITSIEFIADDARNYLSKAGDYDLIILDPPKLVPSKKHIERAKNYYRYLHRETIKAMQPGALLLTCNCSSALSTQQFTELVGAQAQAVGKTAKILGVYGPALCHPTLPAFPEGNYLTAVLLGI